MGCLLTPPDDEKTLIEFYRKTKPWGFWKPILEKVKMEYPDFKENKDFSRDVFNVITGIVWQMALVILPIFLVIREWNSFWISLIVLILTSWLLKKFWLDKLEKT